MNATDPRARNSTAPHRTAIRLRAVPLCPLLLVLVSCGSDGGTPSAPTPPTPAPTVATVTVHPEAAEVVPQETLKLEASALDAAGAPVAGAAVSWASGSTGIATVASDGTVTGVAPGSAQITATSGGRTKTITISVLAGGMAGTAGGTARFGDDVEVVVPAGAVTAPRRITITSEPAPPADPHLIPGTSWRLAPDGSTFTQPVTVRLRYPLASVPAGYDPRKFRIARWDGTAWQPLENASVDVATRTVSGTTTGFSVFAIVGAPPAPAGTHWERVPGVTLPNGPTVRAWTEFDGRLWVVTGTNPFAIRSTADGITWTTVDHVALGVPDRRIAPGNHGYPGVALASTADEIVFLFSLEFASGPIYDSQGRGSELWVLRGDGNEWKVQANTTPGLDQAPPVVSHQNFRVTGIGEAAASGDRIVVSGLSQWWLPFQTGDLSFLVLSTSTQSPSWKIFADDKPLFGRGGTQIISGVAATRDGFFAVGRSSRDFQYWRSSDGVSWSVEPHPGREDGPSIEGPRIAAGDGGLVAVRARRELAGTTLANLAWHSHDGVEWHESILDAGSFGTLQVIASGEGFLTYGPAATFRAGRVWISNDGRNWESVDAPTELVTILPLNGGLVGIDRSTGVWRSGF